MGASLDVIYAGCSGYSFKEWVGRFYPPRTAAKDFLSHYAERLNSVEINHTFRRFPRPELMASWAETTPESFRFSFKMHQSITHRKRLNDVARSVEDFVKALLPLGPRLGVVLFQLPPTFKRSEVSLERLDALLGGLPPGHRFAIEFRHDSWREPEVVERLKRARVGLCAAEVELDDTTPEPTAPFAYIRLRKPPPYDADEISAARALVERVTASVEDTYVYVKHDDAGMAPECVRSMTS